MVEIFRVKEERNRFLNDVGVLGFINEQALLDNYLFDDVKKLHPDLLKLPYLQTQSGSPSKSKCVTFFVSARRDSSHGGCACGCGCSWENSTG